MKKNKLSLLVLLILVNLPANAKYMPEAPIGYYYQNGVLYPYQQQSNIYYQPQSNYYEEQYYKNEDKRRAKEVKEHESDWIDEIFKK